jgi:hypothetical protein
MGTICTEVKICIGTDSNKAKMYSSIKLQKKKTFKTQEKYDETLAHKYVLLLPMA